MALSDAEYSEIMKEYREKVDPEALLEEHGIDDLDEFGQMYTSMTPDEEQSAEGFREYMSQL